MIETPLKLRVVRDELIKDSKVWHFSSALNFMDEHMGFRKGKVHLLLGSTGCGKSTMVRTLILDCIMSEKEYLTGVYLSEETEVDFYTELGATDVMDECYQKLHVISEQDKPANNPKLFMEHLVSMAEAGCEIIFLDNITTSRAYENARPNEQGNIIDALKKFATKRNIALVVIAHTAKGSVSSNNRLIDVEDVRGSGALANASPIAWTLQRVDYDGLRASVVTIAKNRGYSVKNRYFLAKYHASRKVFCEFKPVQFSEIKEIFKARDKI